MTKEDDLVKAAELKAVTHERDKIFARVERIREFLENFNPHSDDISLVQARQTVALNAFNEYHVAQTGVEDRTDDANLGAESIKRLEFEKMYYLVTAQIASLLSQYNKQSTPVPMVNTGIPEAKNKIKLPTIQLPEFSGDYSEWLSFRDTFKTVIHENTSLSDIEKLHYLRSTLKGDALSAVESLSVANANYNSAWGMLTKRYENQRIIVHSHVRNIVNAPNLTKSNSESLRKFIDNINLNIESLKLLKIPVDQWDAVIVPIISDKFDFLTNKEWQAKLTDKIPTLDGLLQFLEQRYQYLESLHYISNNSRGTTNQSNNQFQTKRTQFKPVNKTAVHITSSNTHQQIKKFCALCNLTNHHLFQCNKFLKFNIPERIERINKLNVCNNCLKADHKVDKCNSTKGCKYCNGKHNSLIHIDTPEPQPSTSQTANHCRSNLLVLSEALLSTAIVYIMDHMNQPHECRVLLDGGSQSNFITREMCVKLKLPIRQMHHQITGINMTTDNITDMVTANIQSKDKSFSTSINCLVLNKITQNLPLNSFPLDTLVIPENITLADKDFNISNKVDLLIGTQLFLNLMKAGKISLTPQLVLQNTSLGWIVGGTIHFNTSSFTTCNLAVNSKELDILSKQVSRFWELESTDIYDIGTDGTNPSQQAVFYDPCETHFRDTFQRSSDGRFIVSLPFKDNTIKLGNSYAIARKRWHNLENKLQKNHSLREKYVEFMREYRALGHMEPVPESEITKENVYYIPHHAVFKDDKIRVVFDASCKTSNNLSLNDNLLPGPVIQNDLFSIITRFRTFNVVLKADICKMFRQILINPEQADYQRILWRENIENELKTYRLLTVTYGVTSSPFLSVRCLQQLAFEFQDQFPLESKIILRDFYMDDVLTGCNSTAEAEQLIQNLKNILNSGGFKLAKWASNDTKILHSFQTSDNQTESVNLCTSDSETKTLGLVWNCYSDTLRYHVEPIILVTNLTKRYILSSTCRIFDPLGLVSPVIIRAKLLLQEIWKLKLGWDDAVPPNIQNSWLNLISDLENLNQVKVKRNAFPFNSIDTQLWGFADASESAYGAALYIKSVDANGATHCNLLTAKSRVAPLKPLTIPRLELQAALLLARLAHRVSKELEVNFSKINLFSDSTIVLSWLSKPPTTWKTYVAHRVAEIQGLTKNARWYHVNSESNPADIISRGTTTTILINHELWWHGPQGLMTTEPMTPLLNPNVNELPEVKRISTVVNVVADNTPSLTFTKYLFSRFSDFGKLIKCVGWILRYINNCKGRSKSSDQTLSVNEINQARNEIIRLVQLDSFAEEIHQLKTTGTIKKKGPLSKLNPFLDDNQIIRVGGRLRHAQILFDKKFPAILPKHHVVTRMIIRHFHVSHLHSGAQGTLAAIRQVYWILCGRNVVRSVLHKCVDCFKTRPIISQQQMGDLPPHRLAPARPFSRAGVDYCGPIYIRESRGRSKKTVKAYIALFVCVCTKAVHLELVSDLTTEGFLNALRRFMSRRGKVTELHSDNATNFIGSKNELQELKNIFENQLNKKKLITNLASENIKWHFIPPRTPNFGGLWEANIKSVKGHIKRVIGEQVLTFEEMYTLLTRIEACINSRPLLPLTSDPNDLTALTPGHFLIGDALTAPPEPDLEDVPVNRLTRWQLVENMRQHFWRRWHKEYISHLQPRNKWQHRTASPIKPGALVLIVEDHTPPLHWPLGRVEEVHPGKDGLVRVVTVRTNKGVYKRGISKVAVLPIDTQ